jgi:methenyltetrahydrofolate cyclohydrolase
VFLARVAAREPAPGGGAVAALTVASAAALVAMAARFSSEMEGVETVIARAERLRNEAIALADEDARCYTAVLEAYRRPRDAERPAAIVQALGVAADVPLAVIERARETGELGLRVRREGNPNLHGDAATAVLLADGAARSAAYLVEINVVLGDLGTGRTTQATAWCAELNGMAAVVTQDRR